MLNMNKYFSVMLFLIPSVASAWGPNYLISPEMEQLCNTLVAETKAAPLAPINVIRASVREKVQDKNFDDGIFNLLFNEATAGTQREDGAPEEYTPQNCGSSYAVFQAAKENREKAYGAPVQHRNDVADKAASYLSQFGGSLGSTYSGGVQTQQQNKVTPTVAVATNPGMVSDCDAVLAYESCNKESASGVFEFARDWIQKLGGEKSKACNCLSKKLEYKYKGEESSLNKRRRELDKKLTNAVYAQLGKKFLNDYAANIENITFYTSSVSTFFGKTEAEQEEKAMLAQCSSVNTFETAIHKKCKKISPNLINHRINSLLGVYGKKDGNLQQKLKALNYSISVLDDDGSTKNSDGQVYTRADHDRYRASLSKTDPLHKLVDSVVLSAMQDPKFINKLDEEYSTPYEVLSAELFLAAKEAPEAFVQKYMSGADAGMKEKFLEGMKDSSQTPERNIISSSFAMSMGLHPGFDSMMRDKKLLKRAVDIAKQNANLSLTAVLESKESGLLDKFQEQCRSIVDNFAEAVCLDPEKMNTLISNEQALKLIPLPYEEQDIVRDIMCKNNSEGDSNLMQNLLMENLAEKRSDFHDRMNTSVENQSNPFRKMYTHIKDKDDTVMTVLNDSMRQTRGMFSSVKGENLLSKVFGTDLDSKSIASDSLRESKKSDSLLAASTVTAATFKPEQVADVNGTFSSLAKSESFQKSSMNHGQMIPQAYQNTFVAAAQPQQTAVASGTRSLTDIKKEFRDFLSNESNKENVDRLVSGADDSMMKELSKLRDEYTRNQTKLSELSTEHERLKLKMMEDQMRSLEQERTQLLPEVKKDSKERTAEGSGLAEMRREIASVTQMDTGSASAGVTSGGAASAGIASGGKGSVSIPSGSQQAIASPTTSGGDSSPAVIVSSQAAKASGLTLESSDYSQEVMSYLEKGSVDINTLIKMKTTGMVYKYKVVENGKVIEKEMLIDYQSLNENAKKMIDQKIAAKGIDVRQLERIDGEMKKLKRAYTYNSLKVILSEQLKK